MNVDGCQAGQDGDDLGLGAQLRAWDMEARPVTIPWPALAPSIQRAARCCLLTYTYMRPFHGGTIFQGGWYHFSGVFHGGTILTGGGTIF